MSLQTSEHVDVIVIGAGQAGLSAGYFLNKHQLNYVIFDRGGVAESWKSQRWDSMTLDSPEITNLLPGESPENIQDDLFSTGKEFGKKLADFAGNNEIPVKEYHQVISLDKADDTGLFEVKTSHNGEEMIWTARKVIVASGMLNEPKIPSVSRAIPAAIKQFHSSQYRNAAQMPEGNILVVGSGRSGSAIAEDLSAAGRRVYLATSKVGRIPRRYRGKDIASWTVASGLLDVKTSDITDPAILTEHHPLVSGRGRRGHTISLQMLHKEGVTLMGRLLGYEQDKLLFGSDAVENIRFADQVSASTKQMIEGFINQYGLELPEPEFDEADVPDPDGSSAETATELDIAGSGITSIIWATGLTGSLNWMYLPVLDEQGQLVHVEGVSPIRGLFFLGFPWLRKRKSGVIYGMPEDAAYITDRLTEQ
ncbi:flavin-containing monooxygenase [Pedobacter hartonius]|uniref:Putative flavoprotein involved in K+ transport n=1 Tax=Pedobacter hartonius TaxID=425514 RepID=A0A1H4GLM4_9SPHI|nr:NAD(P)/FAD-dependent oxidoreductase [Pedobacter hartonius]SEB10397.1 putative flavoprotein involved in K+ transport [Pedobacter hartonius]